VTRVWIWLLVTSCDFGLKAAEDVPRAMRESTRVREVRPWAGRYVFSECAPDTNACWSYVVEVDSESMGTLRADGEGLAVHVNTKPRVKDGALRLAFESYIDGGPGPTFFQLGPINKKGFDKGEVLAALARDREGRLCLSFAALESPRKTNLVCANP
jgi:hypothetical protein